MKPEVKEEWLEALRSGKYQQGKRQLRSNNDEFCCLGVLCDIMGYEWNMYPGNLAYGVIEPLESGDYQHTNMPPNTVFQAAGLWDSVKGRPDQQVNIAGEQTSLTAMNDAGSTFEQIANVIEREL